LSLLVYMLLILILYFKSPWAGHVEVALHICLSADQHKIDLLGPDKFWLFFKSKHSENKHLLHRMWWFDQIPWWQLSRFPIHAGKSMVAVIIVRNFSKRFDEFLGWGHISTKRDAENVEPIIDNGLVAGLIKKELEVLWRTSKYDGQRLNGSLEELGCCRLWKVENVRSWEGWCQCKGDCGSLHDEDLDF
jgi:hypothetical protein